MRTDDKEQQKHPRETQQGEPPAADASAGDAAMGGAPAATGEPATETGDEPPPRASPSGRSTRIWLLAYVATVPLLFLLGAAGAWYYLQDRFDELHAARTEVEQRVAAISQRLQAIESKVQPLASRLDQVTSDVGELKTLAMPTAQLAAKAADIEQRLTRLDEQLQQMASTHLEASDLLDRVTRLETNAVRSATLDQRVEALEASGAEAREALMRGSSIVLAVGNLARAVEDSEPFTTELTTLKVMAGGDEKLTASVKALEPFAATGVPTLAKLRGEFPSVALAVSRDQNAAAGTTWQDRIVNRLTSLVTVRRTGPEAIAAGGTEGLLAEAERSLATGDLADAVAAVGKIDGPGAKAAAGWLKEARARLAADQALAALEDRAIAYLSQVKG